MHLLRIREAAVILNCHPYSLYPAIYQGRVKAVKFKGNIRIPAEEVEKLLERSEKLQANLTATEVSRIMGCSVSTVLRLIRKRALKAERIGKCYSIRPSDLEDYVLSLPGV